MRKSALLAVSLTVSTTTLVCVGTNLTSRHWLASQPATAQPVAQPAAQPNRGQ